MIFALSYRLVSWVHALFWRYAPSNIVLRYLRSPRGLKWAFPVSAVMAPAYYFAGGSMAYLNLETGNMWLAIPALLFWISAVKFAGAIVLSPFWMLAHCWRGRRPRSAEPRGLTSSGY